AHLVSRRHAHLRHPRNRGIAPDAGFPRYAFTRTARDCRSRTIPAGQQPGERANRLSRWQTLRDLRRQFARRSLDRRQPGLAHLIRTLVAVVSKAIETPHNSHSRAIDWMMRATYPPTSRRRYATTTFHRWSARANRGPLD